MTTAFPTALDTFSNPTGSTKTNNLTTPHAAQHANVNDAIEAIEAKLGIGASTATAGDALIGTGTGTTAFKRHQLVNQLTNGGFEVWQFATSYAAMADEAYACDYWQFDKAGSSALTVTRESSIIDAEGLYSAKLDYTHNSASTFKQRLDVPERFRGKTLTLRARVRSNAASAVRVRIDDSAGSGTASSYHTGGGAFETLIASKAINAAATTVTVIVELNATTSATYLDNFMLVFGDVACDYVPLHPVDELARCQRRREIFGGGIGYHLSISGYIDAAANPLSQNPTFATTKGGVPTVTKNGTWSVGNCAQPIADGASPSGFRIYALASGAGWTTFYPDSADDLITAEWAT